jgi:hypothetical protein
LNISPPPRVNSVDVDVGVSVKALFLRNVDRQGGGENAMRHDNDFSCALLPPRGGRGSHDEKAAPARQAIAELRKYFYGWFSKRFAV